VRTLAELDDAFARARAAGRTTVIAIETAPDRWTPGGAFWDVGVAEVSDRAEIAQAYTRLREGRTRQRVGW
jgi:3D-(3,5/4)-trihydroxycyclohexane-1,2-dione acylhydrolase (decyclizing)